MVLEIGFDLGSALEDFLFVQFRVLLISFIKIDIDLLRLSEISQHEVTLSFSDHGLMVVGTDPHQLGNCLKTVVEENGNLGTGRVS